jgi:hypothetical protein
MTDASRRSWSAALAVTVASAVVALAAPSFAYAGSHGKDPVAGAAGAREGIVQSVSAKALVLRELDGRVVRVPVAASTRVFVDGKLASLRAVKAGFVASLAWKVGKPARVLQAFDLSGKHPVIVGVVVSVSAGVLVVTKTGGITVSIHSNAKTHILLDGKAATLAAVKTGYTVVISANDATSDKPAHELRFLRPV